MRKIALHITCFILLAQVSISQDIHYSHYDYNPIFQNPGNTGQFDGDYRFHFNLKDQWRSVTAPFQTISVSADTRLRLHKNLGIGVNFFHDVVGDGSLRTIEFVPSVSYLLKLTSDSTHTIRPGFQIGLNNRSVNADAFYFDAQFNGIFFDENLPTNENFGTQRRTNMTTGLGLIYEYFESKRKRITGGIGFFNLNRPNQAFIGTEIKRDIRFNLHARGQFEIDLDWDIIPSFQLNIQGKYRELVIGSQARYILVESKGEYKALYFGAFYRNRDSGYLLAGFEYQNWWAGISYDFNFSKLVPASRVRGGLEISARYILKTFKPKKILHRVCPDYI